MIELLVAGAGLAWLGSKIVGGGDKAVKGAVRSVKRGARNVADKADLVLQPCASGRAPHTRWVDYETIHAPGLSNVYCRVCGTRLPS